MGVTSVALATDGGRICIETYIIVSTRREDILLKITAGVEKANFEKFCK